MPIFVTDLLLAKLTRSVITCFVIRLLRSRTPAQGRSAMRALYLSGSLGLLAFLIGSLATS